MRYWLLERFMVFNAITCKKWGCPHCDELFYVYDEARRYVRTCPVNPRNHLHADVLQGLERRCRHESNSSY